MSILSGIIQIWNKLMGSVSDALYSEWRTPFPADIACTSPGRITDSFPMLSLCASLPVSGIVIISMFLCGWVSNPRPGAITSSLKTRMSPKPINFGL